jgi:hypothetical protein
VRTGEVIYGITKFSQLTELRGMEELHYFSMKFGLSCSVILSGARRTIYFPLASCPSAVEGPCPFSMNNQSEGISFEAEPTCPSSQPWDTRPQDAVHGPSRSFGFAQDDGSFLPNLVEKRYDRWRIGIRPLPHFILTF